MRTEAGRDHESARGTGSENQSQKTRKKRGGTTAIMTIRAGTVVDLVEVVAAVVDGKEAEVTPHRMIGR